ncbi:hypothetical protein ACU4GI_10090 [Cupriavidus basilensis]|jgi:hypothetical protein|uniref:hypothetical protein n=1 Tax=Cupriavidus TaxID=106589 RepID=UPI00044757A8|nr:hypothetical protein [Cupriavidus basilensis]KJK20845.1 hypothetical protein UB46_30460 [Burkholderiaceae bacterium 16]MDF3884826.1 hypothetical protein [Cupriavidus basilensis]
MFLIWQGLGFLVVIVPLAVMLVMSLLGSVLNLSNVATIVVALILSAVAVFYLGRRLNSRPGRILVDPKTQEPVELRKRHTLFWIPMQYWAVPILIIAGIAAMALFTAGA